MVSLDLEIQCSYSTPYPTCSPRYAPARIKARYVLLRRIKVCRGVELWEYGGRKGISACFQTISKQRGDVQVSLEIAGLCS